MDTMLRFFRLVFALPRLSLLFLALGIFGGAASLAFANPPTTRPFSPPSERPSLGTSQTAQQRRIADEKARRAKDPLVRRIQQIGGSLASSLIQHGLDPDNPWMLAHMLLAFGKDLRMPDGKLVIERIVESALQFREVKGQKIPYFPKGDDSHRIEPHPFMHTKIMLALGVPWDYRFKVHGQSVTLGQLHQGLVQSFPAALNEHQIPEFAWAFDAMYGRLPNQAWEWTNAEGEKVSFLPLLRSALLQLEADTRFLRELKAQGVTVIQKKRQGVHAHACGGMHFIQAMIRWSAFPGFQGRLQPYLANQIDLVFYRMQGEVALYQGMLKQYASTDSKDPNANYYRFLLNLQQMKFLGHALETLMLAYRWGVWRPTTPQRKATREGVIQLLNAIETLQSLGFYNNPLPIKQKAYQFYLDLIGDAGHAVHALRLMPHAMFEP